MAVGSGVCDRAEKEIGGELIVDPYFDGLSVATHHDADRGHHGNGSGQSSNQDGASPERGG
jgi:hypothetical protein